MKLHLTNGYPYPYPTDITPEEGDRIADNLVSLVIEGVQSFEMKHTVTVEFLTHADYDIAKDLTGWRRWDRRGILEATTSVDDGYKHPAIIVGDKAYCGFFLEA